MKDEYQFTKKNSIQGPFEKSMEVFKILDKRNYQAADREIAIEFYNLGFLRGQALEWIDVQRLLANLDEKMAAPIRSIGLRTKKGLLRWAMTNNSEFHLRLSTTICGETRLRMVF